MGYFGQIVPAQRKSGRGKGTTKGTTDAGANTGTGGATTD